MFFFFSLLSLSLSLSHVISEEANNTFAIRIKDLKKIQAEKARANAIRLSAILKSLFPSPAFSPSSSMV